MATWLEITIECDGKDCGDSFTLVVDSEYVDLTWGDSRSAGSDKWARVRNDYRRTLSEGNFFELKTLGVSKRRHLCARCMKKYKTADQEFILKPGGE